MLDNATDVVTIRVEVNAPVIVSHSPDYQIAFEGDTVKMSCAANGIPEPSISWAFNKTREDEFMDFQTNHYRVHKFRLFTNVRQNFEQLAG